MKKLGIIIATLLTAFSLVSVSVPVYGAVDPNDPLSKVCDSADGAGIASSSFVGIPIVLLPVTAKRLRRDVTTFRMVSGRRRYPSTWAARCGSNVYHQRVQKGTFGRRKRLTCPSL